VQLIAILPCPSRSGSASIVRDALLRRLERDFRYLDSAPPPVYAATSDGLVAACRLVLFAADA